MKKIYFTFTMLKLTNKMQNIKSRPRFRIRIETYYK